MKTAQIAVREAIETLKLEFDLYPEDNIGDVYEAGDAYRFIADVHAVLDQASSDVFIIDPYFDAATFSRLISSNFALPVKILCNKEAAAVVQTATTFTQETGVKAEVKKTKKAHDRLIILDGTDCWLLGASIKDGGKKPTYLIPIAPDAASKKVTIYRDMWNSAI